jgi:hypothetical protein
VPEIDRRPGAYRVSGGGVVAAQLSLTSVSNNFQLRVGTPNFAVSTTKIIESQTAIIPSPILPPTFEDIPDLLPALGFVYQFNTNPSSYSWSIAGTTVFSAEPPPGSATITLGSSSVSNYAGSEDRTYMLPLSKNSGLLIYVVNRLTLRHVYRVTETTIITAENARVFEITDAYTADIYDQKTSISTSKVLFSTETFSDYSIDCFFISNESVKEVETPGALNDAIRSICPPLTANGTTPVQSVYERSEQYIGVGGGAGASYFTTFPDIMATEQSIDLEDWRESGYYGDYSPADQTLGLHFGILTVDSDYLSRFFTPAAFAFIKGDLIIDNNSKLYSYMRTNFFPMAPAFFLQQCRVAASCQGDTVDFDVTSVQPVSVENEVASSAFRRDRKYSVNLNGSTNAEIGSELLYAWNWDSPATCRTEALSLGFPPASLDP